MSEVRRLLAGLRERGVRLRLEAGDQLKVRAPKGALTPELTRELKALKAEIIAFLGRSQEVSGPSIAKADRSQPLPLSPAQERLWFLDRLQSGESEQAAYNISAALDLRGELAIETLERSIREVLARHEILRVRIVESDGQPLQDAVPTPFTLGLEDLSHLGEEQAEAEARDIASEESSGAFDLEQGPLFRIRLLRLAPRRHVLVVTQHHIISDGWSVAILLRELGALYTAFCRGESSPLAPLSIQYLDVAAWQRGGGAKTLESQGEYWRQRLLGAPTCLELASDRPRPKRRSGAGGHVKLECPPDLWPAVTALGRELEATPFMVLEAAFACLLSRYGGGPDISIGTPTANRNRPETEALIGLFVNTLVLRHDLASPGLTFRQCLAQGRETVLAAFDHADLPFEEVVRLAEAPRDTRHSPLFQVMFTFNAQAERGLTLPGLEVGSFDNRSQTAKFDLTLVMAGGEDGLGGSLEYSRDLFDHGTALAMARHFVVLLGELVRQPDIPLSRCALMAAEERRAVLAAGRSNHRPGGVDERALSELALVPHQVVEWAESRPDAIAIRDARRELSYAELVREASRLAHHLLTLGVRDGEEETYIGICLERSADLVVAQLAVLLAGAAYVPMDVKAPTERLRFVAEDARLALVITNSELADAVAAPTLALDRDEGEIRRCPETPPALEIAPDQTAYLIYTSGSTGTPKGVMVPHRQLRNLVAWYARDNGLGPGERGGLMSGLAFDAVVLETWPVLASGAQITVPTASTLLNVEALRDWIVAEGLTHIFVPTPMAELLFELSWPAESRLRRLSTGGDAMHRHPSAELPFEVVNNYGPTEATVISTSGLVPKGAEGVPEIGGPIDHFELYILDAELQPVPDGLVGQLYVGGAGVARGYLGRPALTAAAFIPDHLGERAGARLYATGDLVRRRRGRLEFHGRADHQVKIRGIRIELGEIESALAQIDGVREAVVQVSASSSGHLLAWCTANDGLTSEGILESLGQVLPSYMVPRALAIVPKMPLTGNGKLDRASLARRPPEVQLGEVRGPRNPTEEILCGIFAEVLGLAGPGQGSLGIDDDFFDLGGHSLLVTRVVSRIAERLHVELPVRELFEAPSVAALAARLPAFGPGSSPRPPIRPLANRQHVPLSFAQQRLWFLDQVGGDAYGIPVAARLDGPLDRRAMERTFELLVARHESLRTVFARVDGQPVQVIRDGGDCRLAYEDWSGLADEQVEERLGRKARQGFDLARGPLFRAQLLRLGGDSHLLAMQLHHIISDGWSMEILISELRQIYTALAAGRPSPLASPTLQYADFAVWQRELLQGEVLDEHLSYWKTQLEGARPLELPTDHPSPKERSSRGDVVVFEVTSEVSTALLALGRTLGATPFMTLLAAFQVLLGRYTRSSDVVVSAPVANRGAGEQGALETEKLIGFFVNNLALRSRIDEGRSFLELLDGVRAMTLEAWAHQDLPFDKLIEGLRLGRGAGASSLQTPFQQVVFTLGAPSLASSTDAPSSFGGLTFSPLRSETRTAKFDLSLAMRQRGDRFLGELEFSTDLFEKSTVQRLVEHFQNLLAGIVETPEASLESLKILSSEEEQVLLEAPKVDFAPAIPVPRQVERMAAAHPGATALVEGEKRLSYADLNRRANHLAHELLSRGCDRSRPVVIWLDRSIQLIVSKLAVMKCGVAYLPLDPGLPLRRLAHIVEQSGAILLLTDEAGRDRASQLSGGLGPGSPGNRGLSVLVPGIESADGAILGDRAQDDPGNPEILIRAEDLAYVIYTSGSTGRPKGVCVAHGELANLIAWHRRRFAPGPGSRASLVAGVAFDAMVVEVWPALCAGASLAIPRDETRLVPEQLRDWWTEMGITHAFAPTPMAERLVALPWPERSALRFLLTGGDRLKRHPDPGLPFALMNCYGPTECTVITTVGEIGPQVGGSEDGPAAAPHLGQAIDNLQIYIVDSRGRLVPDGVAGELYIGGTGVAMGYWRSGALTAEAFIPDPFSGEAGARLYRSGDLVRRRRGRLEFLGRTDQQIKIRGFRIEPGEIESSLLSLPGVAEAFVQAAPGNQHLVAYIVPADGAFPAGDRKAEDDLRRSLAEDLPEIMVPRHWVWLDEMPLTVNGKIDRRALPEPERGESTSRSAESATEKRLVEIFERLLDLSDPGVEDDFFELGGHSLLVVEALEEIEAEFGHAPPLAAFFEGPTIASLAAFLDGEESGDGAPLVTLQPAGERPPLFLVHDFSGTAWPLRELALELAPEQPVFGLQALGLSAGERPLESYPAMARRFLDEIRRIQPRGPYFLGGYSIGGVIAFEMARSLGEAGEQVASLILLDSHLPESSRGEALELLAGTPRDGEEADRAGDESLAARLGRVREANLEAHVRYFPRPYGGRTLLVTVDGAATEIRRKQLAAWSRWVALEFETVPGDHRSFLSGVNVARLGRVLEEELERAREASADDRQMEAIAAGAPS